MGSLIFVTRGLQAQFQLFVFGPAYNFLVKVKGPHTCFNLNILLSPYEKSN